jgi:hypothetical protein
MQTPEQTYAQIMGRIGIIKLDAETNKLHEQEYKELIVQLLEQISDCERQKQGLIAASQEQGEASSAALLLLQRLQSERGQASPEERRRIEQAFKTKLQAEFEKEKARLSAETARLKQVLENQKGTIRSQGTLLDERAGQLTALTRRNEAQIRQLDEKQRQIEKTIEENLELQSNLDELNGLKRELEQQIARLGNANTQEKRDLEAEHAALVERGRQLEAAETRVREEIAAYEAKKALEIAQFEKAKKFRAALIAEIRTKRTDQNKEEVDRLISELLAHDNDQVVLEHIAALKAENAAGIVALAAEHGVADADKTAQITALNAKIAELTGFLNSANAGLAEIELSNVDQAGQKKEKVGDVVVQVPAAPAVGGGINLDTPYIKEKVYEPYKTKESLKTYIENYMLTNPNKIHPTVYQTYIKDRTDEGLRQGQAAAVISGPEGQVHNELTRFAAPPQGQGGIVGPQPPAQLGGPTPAAPAPAASVTAAPATSTVTAAPATTTVTAAPAATSTVTAAPAEIALSPDALASSAQVTGQGSSTPSEGAAPANGGKRKRSRRVRQPHKMTRRY